MRKTLALVAFGLLATATAASAQDYDNDSRDNPPPAGADVAYDYLNHEYYRYEGAPPQAPAAREQRGYRDGHVEREPLTGYYSGVRLVYPYRYWNHGCGCWSNSYGRYGNTRGYYGRGYSRADRYVGDDYDTQDYGAFTYNYSTRRYTDHHIGGYNWGW